MVTWSQVCEAPKVTCPGEGGCQVCRCVPHPPRPQVHLYQVPVPRDRSLITGKGGELAQC